MFFWMVAITLAIASPKRDWAKLQDAVATEDWEQVHTLSRRLLQSKKMIPRQNELLYFIEYADYQQAVETNTARDLELFITKYPNSVFTEAAHNQALTLRFNKIQANNSNKRTYQQFIERYPNSIWQKEALEAIEELDWNLATEQNTIESYQQFISNYPEGRYHHLAEERAAVLIYKEIRDKDELSAYQKFIQEYPSSHFVKDARARSEHLAWDQCKQRNSVDGYRTFRDLYPDSEHSPTAKSKELELAWSIVEKAHQIEAYQEFQKNYPDSEQSRLAEKLEWDLLQYNRPPYKAELTSNITRIIREDDGRYRLYLDVQNTQGEFVGGLQKENFNIYDAGYKVSDYSVEGMESNRFVDVVFVVDVSHSMDDKIQTIKEDVKRFAEMMALRNRDYRLGVVSFVEEIFSINGQDYSYGMSPPLTANAEEFRNWIDTLSLQGGSEENDYLGLDIASQLSFRPEAQHILILVTDEPPSTTYSYPTHLPIANKLAKKDMIVYAAGPQGNAFQELSDITGGIHYPLNRMNFTDIMETIIQKISKQYKLQYLRPPNAPPVIDELQVKLRIKPSQALVQANVSNPNLPGSIKMGVSPKQNASMYRLLSNNDVYCSDDSGKNWNLCSKDIPKQSVQNVVYNNSPGQNNMYIHLKNNAVVQRKQQKIVPLPALNNVQAMTNGGTNDSVYYATNQGVFRLLEDNTSQPIHSFDQPYEIEYLHVDDNTNHATTVLGLTNGNLLKLSVGQAPQELPNPCSDSQPKFWQTHPTRRNIAFIGCEKQLHRSADNGTNWVSVPLPQHPDNKDWSIYNLLLDGTDKGLNLLLTTQGLMQSANLGKTWDWSDMIVNNNHNIGAATITSSGNLMLADADKDIVYNLQTVADKEFLFSTLFYPQGSITPNSQMHHYLDEIAVKLVNHPELSLYIEGHTDSSGSTRSNLKLSKDRAYWIAQYLTNQGVPAERITKQWFGESKPLFPNTTANGRAKNRRVEILFLENSTQGGSH